MLNKSMPALATVLGLGLVLGTTLAHAEGKKNWKQTHPRRAEVNKRLNNQNKRIQQGVKSGKLTKQQAQQLHKEDRQIRGEEREMASQNGGHITKQEQRALNQQENKVSREIFNEKHPGGNQPAPAAPTTPPAGQ